MIKVIRLSRYKFEKDHIQHNVTFSVSGLFNDDLDVMNENIRIMSILLESLFPNTITITCLKVSARPALNSEIDFKSLNMPKREQTYNVGDEIPFDSLKDLMYYCYKKGLELELDILDIKNQHITAVANKDIQGFHYVYGTPETFTKEYIETIKKKLKDCVFDGSFRKTL